MDPLLLSQIGDPFTGSGWAGAGLLGLVLGWLLLKHLPAKDAQLEKLIERQELAMKDSREDFKGALAQVIKHCEDEMREIVKGAGR